jgi:hypothetical protein
MGTHLAFGTARRLLAIVVVTLSVIVLQRAVVSAQSLSAAERRAQINRIIDGLNSADPATRIATLEQATRSKDLNLRHIALSTAFASSDGDLRSAALLAAVGSTPALAVEIVSELPGAYGNTYRNVAQATGSVLEIRISNFQRDSGTFQVSSRFASANRLTNQPASGGTVSGERISFSVPLNTVGMQCVGSAQLQDTGSTLVGSMGCSTSNNITETYNIKIGVLR